MVGPNTKTKAQKASQRPGDAVSCISKAALKAQARCMGLQVVMVTLKPGAKTAQVKGDQRAIHTCMQRLECSLQIACQYSANTARTLPCSLRPGRQVGCHGAQVQGGHEQHVQDRQAGVVLAL